MNRPFQQLPQLNRIWLINISSRRKINCKSIENKQLSSLPKFSGAREVYEEWLALETNVENGQVPTPGGHKN